MNFDKDWMESYFLVLMVVGIAVALASPSVFISYVIIFIAGFFGGRIIYGRRNKIKFPYLVIIGGFLIGYLIGAYYGSTITYAILFALGGIAGFKIYEKRIISDTKY